MIGIMCTLIWIILWNIVFVDVFKEKFEKMLPFSLICAALLVYISGLFGSLRLGFYATLFIILIYICIKVIEYTKHKKWNIPVENILTSGFVITIVVYIMIIGMNWVRGFNHWDDYMHWGSMVKYNFSFDQFYCFDKIFIFAHKDYPPIASLFETIWCYLANGYSETVCIQAMQFLQMSFLLVLFTKIKLNKNSIGKLLLTIGIIMTVILVLPELSFFYYDSIYVDSLIGIMFGYAIYFVFSHELNTKNLLLLSLISTFLILLKQIGLAFYGLILFAIFVKLILNFKELKFKKIIQIIAIVIGIPLVFYLSWKYMVSIADVNGSLTGQFSYSDLKVFDIFGIIKGTIGEQWQIETASKFIHALFDRPMFYKPIQLSYVLSLVVINAIYFMICVFFKRSKFKTYFATMVVYNIGAIGYAFGMLMLYVFAFGPYEGPILASFERYMATYILSGVLIIIFNIFEDFEVNWKSLGCILIAFIVTIPVSHYSRLKPSLTYSSWGDGLKPYAEMLNDKIAPGKSILMMEQEQQGIHHYILGYYLMPLEMNAYSFGAPKYENDVNSVEFSQEEFDELIMQYDYFYIYMFDDEGNKLLQDHINPEEINFSTLFEVKKEQGDYFLVPVK
ncbi:hypothetical protein [Anaerorhabdus sp.]|uniref:hypothetical protein n=1 Tax=Anaerorhabdus sp. TaxID=1872524 RepID=UPI002FC8CC38